jgi:tRNA-2-methylthio-N6-dimethylallyladenosine synthase
MTYYIETYGCQMNVAESDGYRLTLDKHGLTESPQPSGEFDADTVPDVILLNTCSVRETAETRIWGRLAHYAALKKKGGRFTLIIAGCMSARVGDKLLEKGADFVFGPTEKEKLGEIVKEFNSERSCKQLCQPREHISSKNSTTFLTIMEGCNNFCSYCIVPYLRGREKSRDPEEILTELDERVKGGLPEITLLGQNVNSYHYTDSAGKTTDFPELLQLIATRYTNKTLATCYLLLATSDTVGLKWVRFLSSHPKDLDERTIAVMAEHPLFARHIHLCVQHGSNKILSAMNRKYTREQFLALVEKLRAAMPDITLSTDILVGFPGETEDDVRDLLELMDAVRFTEAFMYHYNPREGTAADKLPGRIPEAVKIERLSRVIEKQKAHTLEHLRGRVGATVTVLADQVSRKNADEVLCHTEHEERVLVPRASGIAPGDMAEVQIKSLAGNTLIA